MVGKCSFVMLEALGGSSEQAPRSYPTPRWRSWRSPHHSHGLLTGHFWPATDSLSRLHVGWDGLMKPCRKEPQLLSGKMHQQVQKGLGVHGCNQGIHSSPTTVPLSVNSTAGCSYRTLYGSYISWTHFFLLKQETDRNLYIMHFYKLHRRNKLPMYANIFLFVKINRN